MLFKNNRYTFIKLLSLLMAMLLLQLFIYLLLEHYFTSKDLKERLLDNGIRIVHTQEHLFGDFLNNQKDILYSLRDSSEFKNFLQGKENHIKELFLTVAESHPNVRQLRYLDKNGHEIIRINKKGENTKPFIEHALQDKSGSDYFIKAAKSKPNSVYFSKLDLNKERKKIEVPFVPTLRAFLPLEKEGQFNGILIINLFMHHFLEDWTHTPLYDIILSDGEGIPILHFDEQKSWCKDLNKSYTIKDDFPEQYSDILTQPQFLEGNIYSKHYDLPWDNQLISILRLNQEYLNDISEQYLNRSFWMLIILFFIALATSYFISSSIYRLMKNLQEQTDKARAAATAKAHFLANMSHEIRTPMNGILGFIGLLIKGEKDPERIKQFNTIRNSGKTLLDIINDILDFSKIESGKIDIESYPYSIHQLLENITDIFTQIASEKDITLICSTDNALPKCLIGDQVRLKQVLFNLLSNAVKFTPNGGRITLNTQYNSEQMSLYFSISDTGIGIAQENLGKIFEAFGQEDISTTRKFGGTGLGLSISSKLVKLMGGELKVTSELGKGTTFFFELPILCCDEDVKIDDKISTEETVQTVTFKGHILLVEDNKTNQILLSMILDEANITYDIANDGIEAVSMFKSHHYDAIMMDENMPNLGGIEATQQIRQLEQDQSLTPTPIIAVTANALKGDKQRFIDAGMDDYISKPYSEEDIRKILQDYLT